MLTIAPSVERVETVVFVEVIIPAVLNEPVKSAQEIPAQPVTTSAPVVVEVEAVAV